MPPLDTPGPAACTSRDLLLPTAPELLSRASQSPQSHGGPVPPRCAAVWHPSGRCPCGDGARDPGSAPDASPETPALAPRVTLPSARPGVPTALRVGMGWPGGTSGAGGLGTGPSWDPPLWRQQFRASVSPALTYIPHRTPSTSRLAGEDSQKSTLSGVLLFFFFLRKLNISFLFIFMCCKTLPRSCSRRMGRGAPDSCAPDFPP